MGIDNQLTDDHPSVIVGRVKYYYGKSPEGVGFRFENAFIAKDSRSFETKVDLVAFLVNLPDSLDRGRLVARHPDWSEATAEQRLAYVEEDRALLRASAEERMQAGTAQHFSMDLEGRAGPHVPQRVAGPGLSAEGSHWVLGVWYGGRPPRPGEWVWFQADEERVERQTIIPLFEGIGDPLPGARPRYVMAEVVDPGCGHAIVRGATRNLEYAIARVEQYEQGLARPLDHQAEPNQGRQLEQASGPELEP